MAYYNKYEEIELIDENGKYPLFIEDYIPNHYDVDEEGPFNKLDTVNYIHPLVNALKDGSLPAFFNPWEYSRLQNYKLNQKIMHEYNKSLKFVMINCDKEAQEIYNKLLENKRAFQIFIYLISVKCIDNICEISQRQIAKALHIAKSTVREAFKFLYKNNIICKIDKSVFENTSFNNAKLKYVYVLSFKLVWSAHQTWKKDVYYNLPKEMRRATKFDRFVTLDAHILTYKFLLNLSNENLSSLATLFSMCISMRRNNKHKIKEITLAKRLKKSVRTIKRDIKTLREKQIIFIQKEKTNNLYNINSTIMWKNNNTINFEIDVTGTIKQREKRRKRYREERILQLIIDSPNLSGKWLTNILELYPNLKKYVDIYLPEYDEES